jgi:hypothetical protein
MILGDPGPGDAKGCAAHLRDDINSATDVVLKPLEQAQLRRRAPFGS